MNNKSNSFLEVFKSNDETKMRDYLLHNGKKPKPISPFIFEKKDKQQNSLQDKILDENNV